MCLTGRDRSIGTPGLFAFERAVWGHEGSFLIVPGAVSFHRPGEEKTLSSSKGWYASTLQRRVFDHPCGGTGCVPAQRPSSQIPKVCLCIFNALVVAGALTDVASLPWPLPPLQCPASLPAPRQILAPGSHSSSSPSLFLPAQPKPQAWMRICLFTWTLLPTVLTTPTLEP